MPQRPVIPNAPVTEDPAMTTTDRRGLMLGLGSAALLGATAPAGAGQSMLPMAAAGTAATLRAAPLDDAALMHTFMKLRGATDGRLTIGWMDAVNYAFIDGETWPMYRLLAATWQTFRKLSDTLYESRSLEVAHFVDMQDGALLQKLTMPVSGAVVDVPAYRAGPSVGKVALRLDETRDFRMASEGKDGASFFRTGKAMASQLVSQPEREGELFSVREDLNTRILPATPGERGFFYREWTIWKGPWKALANPSVHSVPTEVIYSAATAWRPWMKMGNGPGNTLQNGRGGKVERVQDLPPELLRLTKQVHPDLVRDGAGVLAG
jgi:Protein of unknown function (DUF1838)